MPIITANHLNLNFGEREVFKDLSFSWDQPRIGVLGRNGSGKSTLARLIAGLIAPDAGQVLLDGVDLFKDRKAALDAVGIVFQNPDHQIIFPTVIEELRFGFEQQRLGDAEKRAQDVLMKYGKGDWRDRVIAGLSQGQRHFLALISILEMRPAILILDEPFTGLDIPTVMRLQNIISQFEGMVIHITHDPELVQNYDHCVWLENGNIEREGDAAQVITAYITQMMKWGESDVRTGF